MARVDRGRIGKREKAFADRSHQGLGIGARKIGPPDRSCKESVADEEYFFNWNRKGLFNLTDRVSLINTLSSHVNRGSASALDPELRQIFLQE